MRDDARRGSGLQVLVIIEVLRLAGGAFGWKTALRGRIRSFALRDLESFLTHLALISQGIIDPASLAFDSRELANREIRLPLLLSFVEWSDDDGLMRILS